MRGQPGLRSLPWSSQQGDLTPEEGWLPDPMPGSACTKLTLPCLALQHPGDSAQGQEPGLGNDASVRECRGGASG